MICILLDISVTVKGSNLLELVVSQIGGMILVELGRSCLSVSIIIWVRKLEHTIAMASKQCYPVDRIRKGGSQDRGDDCKKLCYG